MTQENEQLTRDQQVAALGAQYQRILSREEGTPRTMAALDAQLTAINADYRLFDAHRSSAEVRADIEAQVRETVGERAVSLYARLERETDASLDSRRAGPGGEPGDRIREYIAYSGKGFGALDTTGTRSPDEMQSALAQLEQTHHANRAVRLFNDIEHDRGADNRPAAANLLLGGNSPAREERRLQDVGRELQRAGINADTNGDSNYSLSEIQEQVANIRASKNNVQNTQGTSRGD